MEDIIIEILTFAAISYTAYKSKKLHDSHKTNSEKLNDLKTAFEANLATNSSD